MVAYRSVEYGTCSNGHAAHAGSATVEKGSVTSAVATADATGAAATTAVCATQTNQDAFCVRLGWAV